MRVLGPYFRETVYISEVNGAKKVKSDAQIAMNKNSDPVQKIVSLGMAERQCSQLQFLHFLIVRNASS